jgi:hypothetical protein
VRHRQHLPAPTHFYEYPKKELGTIRSASGAYLMIQLDGMKRTLPFHPTWKLRYVH